MASDKLVLVVSILIACYAGMLLYFVLRGRQHTKNLADYSVGSIHFSPVFVGLSLAATLTSAATFIINPGFIALYGLGALLAFGVAIPLGIFISLILLTKSFRKFGKHVQALTMAQWIGKRYGSKSFALFFGFLTLLLITFMVLICVGMTKVLAEALNANEVVVLACLIVFVFGYMMYGGINAMIYTNTLQGIFMIVVAIILISSGIEHFSKGLDSLLEELKGIDAYLVQPTNPKSPLYRDYFEILFCNFIIGLAAVCQPHIITRSLVLKKEKEVTQFLGVAIGVQLLFFTVLISGIYARLRFPSLEVAGDTLSMDSIMSAYVVSEFSVYISLIVIIGLLSAGLSTLEGLIQSIPTSITNDIIEPLFRKQLGEGIEKEKRLIRINKVCIGVIGLVTFGFSYQQLVAPDLSVGIFAQLGVYAYFSAALIPVLFGIFLKDTPLLVPVVASIAAIVIHFTIYYGRLGVYMQERVRNPTVPATIAILSSLGIGLLLYAGSVYSSRNK